MKRIIWMILPVLVIVLLSGGCEGNVPPDESEIRTQLKGEWVNWIGGEDSESLVYIFTETDITEQHIIDGTIAEQHEGTYSITGIEYYRGNWRGTVTAKLGDRLCCLPFRTDRDGNALALGVSENANSPGYAKRLSHFLLYP